MRHVQIPSGISRERETRTVVVFPTEGAPNLLAPGGYAFEELYCEERHCDFRRVMINVYSVDAIARLATINHAFDPPQADAHI